MNRGGFLVYKCRRCGKLNKNIHVWNQFALNDIIDDNFTEQNIIAEKTSICVCDDGNIGVTDLIGLEFDK